jgi:hypothetical protein
MALILRRPKAVSMDEGGKSDGRHSLVLRDALRARRDEALFSGRF